MSHSFGISFLIDLFSLPINIHIYIAGSPLGEFQIEGLSPRKMAKVREVLKTLDIKVYSRRKCSTGL